MVLYQALLDCLADCTFELLTSLPPVVCAAFEKLDNVRVVDTCLDRQTSTAERFIRLVTLRQHYNAPVA